MAVKKTAPTTKPSLDLEATIRLYEEEIENLGTLAEQHTNMANVAKIKAETIRELIAFHRGKPKIDA